MWTRCREGGHLGGIPFGMSTPCLRAGEHAEELQVGNGSNFGFMGTASRLDRLGTFQYADRVVCSLEVRRVRPRIYRPL